MSDAAWLAEPPLLGWQQRFRVRDRLFDQRSAYQRIEIWDTVPFGRALLLDGAVQTTQQDEFIYHEMLVHIPLVAHPNPRRVLVVGGGDGGCLRRVLEHSVREVVQVEIDGQVVAACRQWLPDISAGAYDDPRCTLIIEDAVNYLEGPGGAFDVILVDSTDPVGVAVPLFTERFYRAAVKRLALGGLLATQSGSPLLMAGELGRVVRLLAVHFVDVGVYLANIPSYPGVMWSFCLAGLSSAASRKSPTSAVSGKGRRAIEGRYYTPELQQAAFALPTFLQHLIREPAYGAATAPVCAVPVKSPFD